MKVTLLSCYKIRNRFINTYIQAFDTTRYITRIHNFKIIKAISLKKISTDKKFNRISLKFNFNFSTWFDFPGGSDGKASV